MFFEPKSEEYEEGLEALQNAVKDMQDQGIDFTKKSVQGRFRKALITNMNRLANDKRLFDKVR